MMPAARFDWLARPYRWLEWITFGPMLGRARVAFLDEVRTCQRALVLGDGDGRFTARLLAENPSILIEAIDSSRAMLLALLCRAGIHAGRVQIHEVDARLWKPATTYDLVGSHFFLDCLTTGEVTELAERLRPCMTADARWVISDFAIPRNVFGRLIAGPLVFCLYLAFRLLTGLRVWQLPDYHAALAEAGFERLERRQWLCGLLVAEVWIAV